MKFVSMRDNERNTPPSSVNGDEISGVEEEPGLLFLDEVEEITFENEMEMEEYFAEREEDEDIADAPPVEDPNCVMILNHHQGSVFCGDFHPSGKLAASGGQDDKAYIWSVETGQVLATCSEFKDSVIFVGFSFDGSYFAAADMKGLVGAWKCGAELQVPMEHVYEADIDEIIWGLWHFGTNVLIFGTETGFIYVFKIPSGETKVLQGTNVRCTSGKLFPDGQRLAVGYDDGSFKVWDLKTCTALHSFPANTHPSSVAAIDTHLDNNLMATISPAGFTILTTSTNGKNVAQLLSGKDDELECVAFATDPLMSNFLATGTLIGGVNIWDTTRSMVRHECVDANHCEKGDGVVKMLWIKDHLVYACVNGSVRVFDGKTGKLALSFLGHTSEILDICYNEKANLILTTSDDCSVRLFRFQLQNETSE